MVPRSLAPFVLVAVALTAAEARAGCCAVVKLDTTAPTVAVRVCDPDAEGACGTVLFEDELSIGQSQSVCAAAGTLVYQERLPAASEYEPPVTAVCESGSFLEIEGRNSVGGGEESEMLEAENLALPPIDPMDPSTRIEAIQTVLVGIGPDHPTVPLEPGDDARHLPNPPP